MVKKGEKHVRSVAAVINEAAIQHFDRTIGVLWICGFETGKHGIPRSTEFYQSTTDSVLAGLIGPDSRHASGMFSNSQQFTVTGGTFTNITKNYAAAPSLPPGTSPLFISLTSLNICVDLRMIPLGDIDLRHQIRVDECTGVAYSQQERACVRRVHSAKARIDGRKSRVTVAMYQGSDSEEAWPWDITKYMSLRHPNIIQICGAASSNGVHATLFNDGAAILISVEKFWIVIEVPLFGRYIFMRAVYVPIALNLLHLICPKNTDFSVQNVGLCVLFLIPYIFTGGIPLYLFCIPTRIGAEIITTFVDSLTLKQYHCICTWNLGQRLWGIEGL
ncbi:hypothetical protein C8R45DRAFT_940589 [Mycena sanguinolenta]|nr:hypothetical protein C8R45DRAFT_940589 [Mycena sanguinolenta]